MANQVIENVVAVNEEFRKTAAAATEQVRETVSAAQERFQQNLAQAQQVQGDLARTAIRVNEKIVGNFLKHTHAEEQAVPVREGEPRT